MDWIKDWMEILLGGGIGAVVIAWLLKNKITPKLNIQTQIQKVLKSREKIYSLLYDCKEQVKSPRIHIIRTQNGGGVPNVKSQLYATILYESPDSSIRRMKDQVQNLLIDEQYNGLLTSLLEKGECEVFSDDLPEGILKDNNLYDDVKFIYALPIICLEDQFIHMIVYWRNPDVKNDLNRYRGIIKSTANNLKQIFEEK